MAFSDRWKKNDDGSFTDTKDDSSSSSSSDDDDSSSSVNPGAGLTGGGGTSGITDDDDSDSSSSDDDSSDSGSSGGSSDPLGGGSDADLPDAPSVDQDNPFDDSDSGSSGGSSSSDDDKTPEPTQTQDQMLDGSTGSGPDRQSGSGIGPSGVSGSEAATPDAETDASNQDSTEGIEATKTGELEDTAQSRLVQEQAQNLEGDVAGTKITDAVSGLKTTGAEFRKEDLQVTREGDELRVELSPVGRERVGNIAERQQQESVERQLERELNSSFTGEDVSVDSDGNVEVSQRVRSTAREQQRRAQTFQGTPNGPSRQRTSTARAESTTDTTSDEITRNPDGTVTENLGYAGYGVDVTYGQYGQGLVGLNDPNQDIQDSLTQGRNAGILTDQEEAEVRGRNRVRRETYSVGDEVGGFVGRTTGSETAATVGRALGDLPGALGAGLVGGTTLLVDTGAEATQNLGSTVGEYGVVDTGGAVFNTVTSGTRSQVNQFRENPVYAGTQLTAEVLTGAAAGKVAGRASRVGKDRVRTAGSTDITDEVMSEGVKKFQETDGAEGERFPGADNPEQFKDDPAQAVRDQADSNTPDELEQRYQEQGVEEGVVLKKGLDAEPQGPGRGRAAQGLSSPEADSDLAGEFELQGNFLGPEVSPNFLRIQSRSARFSLRPGLPDTGSKPTVQTVKTDVENPDARTNKELDDELQDTDDMDTARTKPRSEVNTGEIEAVAPPGSEFSDIGGRGFIGETARRLGIGSDFRIEVGGRRVPVRPAAPKSRIDDTRTDKVRNNLEEFADDERADVAGSRRGDADADGDTTVTVDGDANARRAGTGRSSRRDGPSQPVDRPLPTFGFSGSGAASGTDSDPSSGGSVSSPSGGSPGISSVLSPSGGFSGGSLFGSSAVGSPGSPGGSGGPSGGSSTGSPSSPGSPGSPGYPGSPGSPSDPFDPNTPTRKVRRDDEKEDEEQEGQRGNLQGDSEEVVTEFLNPLTGERFNTNEE